MLATVLFTDVVGSTQRAAELGDQRWRELLERHHRLLRAEFDRFSGHEVHTAGTDSSRRSIRLGTRSSAPARPPPPSARSAWRSGAGVHTGEVERSDGDVQGLAVHIGARVSALAGAGEVFVSSTVKELVVGSGLEFLDRGEHDLKGVPGVWHVYEVA